MDKSDMELLHWKADALQLLASWDAVFELIPKRDSDLGRLKHDVVADEIKQLTAEVDRLHDEMSTMHRTVVHDCCVQVQSERRLADQLASALALVRHDRPSAHTDYVWSVIGEALNAYEEARRER